MTPKNPDMFLLDFFQKFDQDLVFDWNHCEEKKYFEMPFLSYKDYVDIDK